MYPILCTNKCPYKGIDKPKGFALLSILGDAVNLHYAEASTNEFRPIKVNAVGEIVPGNPCSGLIGSVE